MVNRRTNPRNQYHCATEHYSSCQPAGQGRGTIGGCSGTHSWSYEYRDPDGRGPLSIDHSISELADVPYAWAAIMDAIARLAPQGYFLRQELLTHRKTSLRQALAILPNSEDVLASISHALSRL